MIMVTVTRKEATAAGGEVKEKDGEEGRGGFTSTPLPSTVLNR